VLLVLCKTLVLPVILIIIYMKLTVLLVLPDVKLVPLMLIVLLVWTDFL